MDFCALLEASSEIDYGAHGLDPRRQRTGSFWIPAAA